MPRLISDAVGVIPWKGHVKAVVSGVFPEPAERVTVFEFFFQNGMSGRGEVNRPSAVVFTVSGRGRYLQDRFDILSFSQLSLDYALLVVNRAIGGNQLQLNTVSACFFLHGQPGSVSAAQQALFPLVDIQTNRNKVTSLHLDRQLPLAAVVPGNAQLGMQTR